MLHMTLFYCTTGQKATKWGAVSESPYKKVGPVSVLGGAR